MKKKVIIVGGGAAGIFTAVLCAEKNPHLEVIVLEKTTQLLSKVKISGGGRCNVTHAQFDPSLLVSNYPRGSKELLGSFHRFQPRDTIAWFEAHGVQLKTEEDGRVFPSTDNSGTITHCLLEAAKQAGVRILSEHAVRSLALLEGKWHVNLENRATLLSDYLVLATGSSLEGYRFAQALGHRIIKPVPSLFTLQIPHSPFADLSGITLPDIQLSLPDLGHKQRGALLLTHFGFSGPAALKLSAFAARELHQCDYKTTLAVHWLPQWKKEEILQALLNAKQNDPLKTLAGENLFSLPLNLWKKLLSLSEIPTQTPLSHLAEKKLKKLTETLVATTLTVSGKTAHKAEFVTCGGISLKEVDFKTMQSKLFPHLFFVGEILDIDGVTGGFNFQNAWTTAFIAASCLATISIHPENDSF